MSGDGLVEILIIGIVIIIFILLGVLAVMYFKEKNKQPVLHMHIFGRAKDAKVQKFPEAVRIYSFRYPIFPAFPPAWPPLSLYQ